VSDVWFHAAYSTVLCIEIETRVFIEHRPPAQLVRIIVDR